MKQLFANNAEALLQTSISQTDTFIQIGVNEANLFPVPDVLKGEYFLITIEDQTGTYREIIKISERNNNILTVAPNGRGFEGTGIRGWGVPSLVDVRDTAGSLGHLQRIYNAEITIEIDLAKVTRIIAPSPFESRTTQLYVGGLRQSITADYVEENETTLKLLFELSLAQIQAGQNIVLDYSRF